MTTAEAYGPVVTWLMCRACEQPHFGFFDEQMSNGDSECPHCGKQAAERWTAPLMGVN